MIDEKAIRAAMGNGWARSSTNEDGDCLRRPVGAAWRRCRRSPGLRVSTINRGEDDLDAAPLPKGQLRRAGGGRRAVL